MSMLYFAYGSNMCTARMRERAPSATPAGTAVLQHYHVICNKLGRDGTGKANIAPRHHARAHGVLYDLDMKEMDALDMEEKGYRRIEKTVLNDMAETVRAQTYVAFLLTHNPVAAGWYKNIMIQGALEHGLPEDYIHELERLPANSGYKSDA